MFRSIKDDAESAKDPISHWCFSRGAGSLLQVSKTSFLLLVKKQVFPNSATEDVKAPS